MNDFQDKEIFVPDVTMEKIDTKITKLLTSKLCIKPGIQERGTECGERGECYIPGNVVKCSRECPQTFREMSPNIPGNVPKHSGGFFFYLS